MFVVRYTLEDIEEECSSTRSVIEYADRVEEINLACGDKFVRATRYITGAGASVSNETNIPLCSDGANGTVCVTVENMCGNEVQRIVASDPFPYGC